MMKVKMTTPYLLQYRTYEVIDLMNGAILFFNKSDTLPEILRGKLAALELERDNLNKEYWKSRGHSLTRNLEKLDKERKGKIKAIRWFLESQLYRESEEKVQAAKVLLDSYQSFCKNIERKYYVETTSLIRLLMQNWMQDTKYVSAVQTLDIKGWVENIFKLNENFYHCFSKRTKTREKKGNCYPIKLRVKALYEDLIESTNAFLQIAEGDHPYQDILEPINNLVKEINTSYNIRQGIRKSKKNKV